MYAYNDIRKVHLELTEKCNAACPMCPRNINGGEENPWLHGYELTLEDVQKFLPHDFLNQLHHIYMCGAFGDPMVAKDCLEINRYFRNANSNLLLSMNTNGSGRNEDWWSELASIYGENGYVVFGIDGLEDTSNIYRRNTNFSRVLKNAKAFIDMGGKAHWEFIPFAHNEHQVEEARQLSKDLGFSEFRVRKSFRFLSPVANAIKESSISIDRKQQTQVLQAPVNPEYRNSALDTITSTKTDIFLPTTKKELIGHLRQESFNKDDNRKSQAEKIYDSATVSCKVQKEKTVYISAEGILQPCSWLGVQMYRWHLPPKGSQVWKLIEKIGKNNLSLRHHSIEEIVNNDYFQKYIPESWDKPSCYDGKLQICAMTCGKETDIFNKQFIDK